MSELPDSKPIEPSDLEYQRSQRPISLILLAILVFIEAIAMTIVTIYLVVETLTQPASSLGGAVVLDLIAAIATVFLYAVGFAILRARPWIRAATFVWQLVQIAVAVGELQGADALPALGFGLLIPSIVVIILLFTPPVVAATRRI